MKAYQIFQPSLILTISTSESKAGSQTTDAQREWPHLTTEVVSQMTPYSLCSAHRTQVKSSTLHRERGAIWDASRDSFPCCSHQCDMSWATLQPDKGKSIIIMPSYLLPSLCTPRIPVRRQSKPSLKFRPDCVAECLTAAIRHTVELMVDWTDNTVRRSLPPTKHRIHDLDSLSILCTSQTLFPTYWPTFIYRSHLICRLWFKPDGSFFHLWIQKEGCFEKTMGL
jgi:hypothetical protein